MTIGRKRVDIRDVLMRSQPFVLVACGSYFAGLC